MSPHVRREAAALSELLLADVALVRTLAGVGAAMVAERGRVHELLVADAAAEWLLARVSAHVILERRRPLELLAADSAAQLRRRAHVGL